MKTVVGLYDNIEDARDTVEDLVDEGFSRDNISLVMRDVEGEYETYLEDYDEDYDYDGDYDEGEDVGEAAAGGAVGGAVIGGLIGVLVGVGAFAIPGLGPVIAAGPVAAGLAGAGIGAAAGGLIGALVEWGVPEEEAEYYAEGVRRGGTLVAIRVADDEAAEAAAIMNDNDPVDIERRAEYWRTEHDWTGFDEETEPYTATEIEGYRSERSQWQEDESLLDEAEDFLTGEEDYEDEETIEVVEEELRVGKRAKRDTVRVHSYVVEEPVEEDVTLREERVTVERRPVDRDLDEDLDVDAFEEKTIEMTETEEEAVVEKRARVIEEIAIRKDVDTRTETVRDTVRHTEVEIDEDEDYDYDGDYDLDDFDAFNRDFRSHYNTYYSRSGYTYDQYQPAYRYGYNLAADPRYRDRDWDEVEPEVERRWEEHNQGTWEDFKDAVEHAWEETKDAVGA